jgi:hypothetical protein
VAQSGLWDVSGTGLQKIENQSLAQAILERTNTMNKSAAIKSLAIAAGLDLLATLFEAQQSNG